MPLVIAASIYYRRAKGRPVFPKAPAEAVFSTRLGSGRCLDNLITSIGGAHNCLLIAVTPRALIVTPCFPFNLIFLPEVYGLEYTVSRNGLTSFERRRGVLGEYMRIEFSTNRPHIIELRGFDLNAFERALRAMEV